MSHSVVLVLIPANPAPESLDEALGKALAPFDENLEVTEYDHPCYCIDRAARTAGEEFATAQFGSWDAMRKSFAEKFPLPKTAKHEFDLSEDEHEKREEAWKAHTSDRIAVARQHAQEHPMAGKPEPDCKKCKGTGAYRSQYNPKSKWDWYVIGGRWTGLLSGFDPATDPDNWETCFLCVGTPGMRNDPLGRKARAEDPAYTCNGCDGKGKSLKWRYKQHAGDVCPTSKVLVDGKLPAKRLPFAILEPDGNWSERGEMGWFGAVAGEKPRAEWHETAEAILARHPDTLAVVVDVHI